MEQPPVTLGNIIFHFLLLKHQGCLAPQFPVHNLLLAGFIFVEGLVREGQVGLWGQTGHGLKPGCAMCYLCDLGQVT